MRISARANETQIISPDSASLNDYLVLCKPRVVLLMMLTSMVGMCLSSPPHFSWLTFLLGNIGIALVAGSAAAVNHIVDQHIDRVMLRTKNRPLALKKVSTKNAILFSAALCLLGMFILIQYVNLLTALLTFLTLIGYAGIYTLYLKHKTPQNIVIGGLAGAAPPLLGWVAMTGHVDPGAILLMLIIFLWTPPHFWALAIYRIEDYSKANVPMLPVTHGIPFTKINIVLYTVLLFGVTLLPFGIGMCGLCYLITAIILNVYFLYFAIRLKRTTDPRFAFAMFRHSIIYLMLLFVAMIVDHFVFLLS